jgi:uncharacterized protein YndB with AHSA1/START domain
MVSLADDRFMLQIRKRVPAPREDVFRTWSSPEGMRRWLVPHDRADARCDMDVRVGGQYRIDMSCEGQLDPHTGEYQRVEPPRLLEFTWISAATKHQPSLVTVELLERGPETEVVLTHSRLPDQPTVEAYRTGWTTLMEDFWESRYQRLDALLDELKTPCPGGDLVS